jgi:hypothetical protein
MENVNTKREFCLCKSLEGYINVVLKGYTRANSNVDLHEEPQL